MIRRLLIVMVLLTAVVSLALALPLALIVAQDQRAAFIAQLEVHTLSTATLLATQPVGEWDATIDRIAGNTGGRVVVVDADLQLVADSDDSGLDRSFDRPEVQQALAGSLASDVRGSATLGSELRYVAAPVIQDRAVVAAVRLSLPEDQVSQRIQQTQLWLGVFVASVMVIAGLVAWILARGIAAPLDALAQTATALSEDLTLRADTNRGPAEVQAVARALNHTAHRLDQLLRRAQAVAAEASHHLRTPLTGIRLRLEAIEDTAQDPLVMREASAAITEVDRLTRRIEQVLALARGDANPNAREIVDLPTVVRAGIEACSPLAQTQGIAVSLTAPDQVWCLATTGSVARCVDEVLGNALTYARSGIDVSLGVDDSMAVL
ncbi:MAG: histidine kinase dimerization/phospho-acceptor domain-containing protein, partial [Actinomycetales bacterium]